MKRLIALLVLLLTAASATGAGPGDIRLLIDTSGSMKQNDPHNLRVPALKLLVNLFPAGTRAGVWLFDTHPQVLVAPAAVDEKWRGEALRGADRIHARGQFTHIEEALQAASSDWDPVPAAPDQRHIVLLTDGVVDVSKNAADSEASRRRVIEEVLPALQRQGVKLHTIALSDQADQDLLRQLALATDGWNEIAADAESLQRSFMQMFNQTTPHDSLPLQDNRFNVDAAVKEFTVLVLLHPGAKPTRLLAPDHSEITQAKPAQDTRWVHEAGYDLVTVANPPAGSWELDAETDPANQVLVVTDLKMRAEPFPSYLTADDRPTLSVHFAEHEEVIRREDFLALIQVAAKLSGPDGKTREIVLLRGPEASERFRAGIEEAISPGQYTLKMVADGRTFQREMSQEFQVIAAPIKVHAESVGEGEEARVRITLMPEPEALVPDTLQIGARAVHGDGHTVTAEAVREGDVWRLEVKPPAAGGKLIVNLTATAKTPDGHDLQIALKPVILGGAEAADAHPPAPQASPAADHLPRVRPEWLKTAAIAGGINIVAGVFGFLVYRVLRKRSQAAIDDLLSKLSP